MHCSGHPHKTYKRNRRINGKVSCSGSGCTGTDFRCSGIPSPCRIFPCNAAAKGQRTMHPFIAKVAQTIQEHQLLDPKDKVIVAVSGGKDSTAILSILKQLGYRVEALTIDVIIGKYTKQNLENIRKFCNSIDVPLHEVSFKTEFGYSLCYLKALLYAKGVRLKSCSICGVLRRYLFNRHARLLGATKLVTGHNRDDESQNVLMK